MIKVHSIETLGALDGPGIRTVVFIQGCNLRCAYCHNADTFDLNGGILYSETELVAFCARYKAYYGKNGGVTLSGGEPLCQRESVLTLIRLLKSEGIHVALDTSGSVFAPEILSECDLIILDIKHTDSVKFEWLTGAKIDNTLKTLEFCQKNGLNLWVRQVILDGFTDSPEQILELKRLCTGAKKIELLPYHDMGKHKWEKLGLPYKLSGYSAPSIKTMQKLRDLIK